MQMQMQKQKHAQTQDAEKLDLRGNRMTSRQDK